MMEITMTHEKVFFTHVQTLHTTHVKLSRDLYSKFEILYMYALSHTYIHVHMYRLYWPYDNYLIYVFINVLLHVALQLGPERVMEWGQILLEGSSDILDNLLPQCWDIKLIRVVKSDGPCSWGLHSCRLGNQTTAYTQRDACTILLLHWSRSGWCTTQNTNSSPMCNNNEWMLMYKCTKHDSAEISSGSPAQQNGTDTQSIELDHSQVAQEVGGGVHVHPAPSTRVKV